MSNSKKDIRIKLSVLQPGWKIKGSEVKVSERQGRYAQLIVETILRFQVKPTVKLFCSHVNRCGQNRDKESNYTDRVKVRN